MSDVVYLPAQCSEFLTPSSKRELELIQEILQDRMLRVAVLGRFNSGKSSLINALISRPSLLPTQVLETTCVVTEVRARETDGISVAFDGGHVERMSLDKLREYTHGSTSISCISSLCVDVRDSLLPPGLVLIDTPGNNSVQPRQAEQTNLAIAQAEVAIYVLATAGLTQEDSLFVREILQFQPRVLLVLNTIDLLLPQSTESDLQGLVEHVRKDIQTTLGAEHKLFATSCTTMQGIEELREELFVSIPNQIDLLKEKAAGLRKRRLYIRISEAVSAAKTELEQQISSQDRTLHHGRLRIALQRSLLEAEKGRRRQKLVSSWNVLHRDLQGEIECLRQSLHARASDGVSQVASTADAERYLLTVREWVVEERQQFHESTSRRLAQKFAQDVDLQQRDLPELEAGFPAVEPPDCDFLLTAQMERLQRERGQLEELRQHYEALSMDPLAESSPGARQRLVNLEEELSELRRKLAVPYEPRYLQCLDPNAVSWANRLAHVGKAIDWAMVLIPYAPNVQLAEVCLQGGLSAGIELIHEEGLGHAIANTAHEVMDTVVQHGGKILTDHRNVDDLLEAMPRSKRISGIIRLIEAFSAEGIGRGAGRVIDFLNGKKNLLVVEDDDHRSEFHQRRQELQMRYWQLQQDVERALDEDRSVAKSEQRRECECVSLSRSIAEREQEIKALEKELENARQQALSKKLQARALALATDYIDMELGHLVGWVDALSSMMLVAVTDGVKQHFAAAFDEIEALSQEQGNDGQAFLNEHGGRIEQLNILACELRELAALES